MRWVVEFAAQPAKAFDKLPGRIQYTVAALVAELEIFGPALHGRRWRHFGKLRGRTGEYHCHLKAGRPTYVACWRVIDGPVRTVEVFYVGTHENAPY